MVPSEIRKIVDKFLNAIIKSGTKVDKAYIFGSYVKGFANQWSDIDIAVVVPRFHKDKFETTIKLRKIALEIDSRIEPIVFETHSFNEDNWVPIIYEIKTHGVLVEIAA